MTDPNVGFDYTKLPKVSHDEYELPEGRTGWTFQGVGRLAIFVYIAAIVLDIVIFGSIRTMEDLNLQNLAATAMIIIGVVPGVFAIIGLIKKPGRWWALLILIATIVLNPALLAIIFSLFVSVIAF